MNTSQLFAARVVRLAMLLAVGLGAQGIVGCRPADGTSSAHDHEHGTSAEARGPGRATLCAEHRVPESECAICNPDRVARLEPGVGMQVRLPSTNSGPLIGLRTARPESGPGIESLECLAEISFNLNLVAQIAVPVGGIIQSVDADLGRRVEENQTVATVWSAAMAEAVAKAVLSHQTLVREQRLRTERVTSERDLQEAEATHRAACQQLRTLGFSEEEVDRLSREPQERVLLAVRAPFAGEITERMAVRGALVEPGKPLFTLVDPSTVWANVQVPEARLGQVRTGQSVELRVDSLPDRVFRGRLTWIAPAVDERTRMARARAEIANPEGWLKDRMYAKARILVREDERACLVPSDAIQRFAGRPFVFVKRSGDLFEVRAVELGASDGGRWQLRSGVRPEEEIAVSHVFALKSATLMSRLGAGCADD